MIIENQMQYKKAQERCQVSAGLYSFFSMQIYNGLSCRWDVQRGAWAFQVQEDHTLCGQKNYVDHFKLISQSYSEFDSIHLSMLVF
jgi:hypothetical protein